MQRATRPNVPNELHVVISHGVNGGKTSCRTDVTILDGVQLVLKERCEAVERYSYSGHVIDTEHLRSCPCFLDGEDFENLGVRASSERVWGLLGPLGKNDSMLGRQTRKQRNSCSPGQACICNELLLQRLEHKFARVMNFMRKIERPHGSLGHFNLSEPANRQQIGRWGTLTTSSEDTGIWGMML
jgi:hypothetical protein